MTDVEKEIDRKLAKIDMKLKEIQAMRDSQRRNDEERRCSHEFELEEDRRRHEIYMREMNKKIDDKFDKIIFQMRLASFMIILFSGANYLDDSRGAQMNEFSFGRCLT